MMAVIADRNGRVAGRLGTQESSVAPPARRVRWPEAATGAALIVVFALAGLLWHLSAVNRTAVVAVAAPVERGALIRSGDVQVTDVAGDGVAWVEASVLDSVVGQVAAVDLTPGMLISDAVVSEPVEAIGPDEGVVGLELGPGQYPVSDLAPGDVVNVVPQGGIGMAAAGESPDMSEEWAMASGAGEFGRNGQGPGKDRVVALASGHVGEDVAPPAEELGSSLVAGAEVVSVEEMASGGDRLLVTLRAEREDAERVASVDPVVVRLVQVAP